MSKKKKIRNKNKVKSTDNKPKELNKYQQDTSNVKMVCDMLRRQIDTMQNLLSRGGSKADNSLMGTEYPLERITQNFNLINNMYRQHWIIRNIIDTIPEDAVKNWIKINSALDPDQITRFENLMRKTRIKSSILEGLKWGRLYGGAAAVIIIEGQEDILEEPLDYSTIMPDSFKGLIVCDRWCDIYPSTSEIVEDVSDPDFGLPMYYQWGNEGGTVKVHHSRVLRFTGRKLPYWEEQAEVMWGASEIEIVYDELIKRDNTSSNITNLIFRANLIGLKMEGLGELLSLGDEEAQKDLFNTLEMQNKLMNNMSLFALDKEDSLEQHQYTFSGLSDIYELFMLDVSGAAKTPVTKLFGRCPAGMNSTGEGDKENYNSTVENYQTEQLEPVLDKLLPIMAVSEFGCIPDDFDYEFNPIETPNEEQVANIVDKKMTAINTSFTNGIITQKIAMMELKEVGAPLGMFTNITDKDIEEADDTIDMPDEDIGGLGGLTYGQETGGYMEEETSDRETIFSKDKNPYERFRKKDTWINKLIRYIKRNK